MKNMNEIFKHLEELKIEVERLNNNLHKCNK